MSLDLFMVFATVAEHRSVTLASDVLHVTQPAVTKQLKLLEERYHAKLYTKGGKGIRLTNQGRIFLRNIRTILRQHERLKRRLEESLLRGENRSLAVGGSYSPSASFLPSLLAAFETTHPHVQLNLRTDNRLAVERMVARGDVELAIINNPPVNRQLTMEPYRSEPVVAFVHSHHPLAGKRLINRDELGRFGFVIRKPLGRVGTARRYLNNLFNQGLRAEVVLRCDTPEGVKEAVRNRLGVGILFRDVVEENVKRGEFKLIKLPGESFEGKSYIVYHKKRPLSALAQEFLALLRQSRNNN